MKTYSLLLIFLCIVIIASCTNKTKKQLAKKWDCVKIENLAPVDDNLFNAQDSAVAQKIKDALNSLVWTFNNDNTYSCSVSAGTTVEGTYEISIDEKLLTLTSGSRNNINVYVISNLTDTEMTLKGSGNSQPVIMHFRPH
ncbi:MAG: DUF4923 family protein [Ferruginibacter sp.]